MHWIRFERMALARFFVAACVAFFGAGIVIDHARAQGTNIVPHVQGRNSFPATSSQLLNRAPSMPPPAFNPSSPHTAPQSPEAPVSPASPGSVFGSSPRTGVN
jgi:hypothetical protein